MRLVSDTSEDELQRRRAEADLRRVLRGMAANLLRVVRGAGRPYQIVSDLSECLICCQAYREAFGYYPPSDLIGEILNPENPDGSAAERRKTETGCLAEKSERAEAFWDREEFTDEAWRAGLQIAASMLVGQQTQLARARSDLFSAVRWYKKSIEERAKLAAPIFSKSDAPRRPRKAPVAPHAARSPDPPVSKPEREKPSAKQRDPFEPPDYSGLHSASLPPAIAEEFGVHSARALVDRLNALWRQQGRRPLPQGSYPSNASQLKIVLKELRLAKAQDITPPSLG